MTGTGPYAAMAPLRNDQGFTLIELIVVMALISIMLAFSMPQFRNALFSDPSRAVSRWLLLTVPALKQRAVREQRHYILHINIDDNRLWVTDDTMSEEEAEAAVSGGMVLPDDLNLLDIEYPGRERITSGQADIHFYRKGYSDKAFIHIEDGDNNQRSYLIEPFLHRVKLYERYVAFET